MPTILVVDDEPSIRFSVEQVFEGLEFDGELYTVRTAYDAESALKEFVELAPDVVLLDVRLGGDDGLALFGRLRELDPKCLVVFITGHGTSETAIEAMKCGALDYILKPLDASQLISAVRQATGIRRLMRTPAIVEANEHVIDNPDLIVGAGEAMRGVFKLIGRVAPQDINVVITGESGTGKELVARAIYHHSRRSQKSFLAINCAALTETLLESELFGHEKGAFTGADRRRIGKFEQAHGGTLFLDEMGDMALSTQAKILRLLQDGKFERVGGSETLHVDVRIIAATNKNIEAMIEAKQFRLDLYYRLRGVTIHLPALRDRKDDIPELAHYFLFRFNRDLGASVTSIAEETLERLADYSWPGNIRELQAVLREALIRAAGSTLLPEFLPEQITRMSSKPEPQMTGLGEPMSWEAIGALVKAELKRGATGVYRRALRHFDRLVVGEAMQKAAGNQVAASQLLGLSRPTLRAKIRDVAALADETPAHDGIAPDSTPND
ncbi:MAG TPA: sigma-54 dependent transcriptional regulator [Pirellulaceae bacterium]|nr:sigma-54 dependent transcriptional regulator [Pirellulaceae bacterium]